MDKFKTFPAVGGLPLVLDDLRWFFGRLGTPNEGMYQAFNNLLRGFGNNLIVQGITVAGSSPTLAISEGWVILNGELLKVDNQFNINTSTDNTFVKVTTFDSRGNKQFQNGSTSDTYEKNRAVVQGTAGSLRFDGDTLVELTTGAATLPDTGRVVLNKKVIEIGDWNMNQSSGGDSNIFVAHGLAANFIKIRKVDVMIIRDDSTSIIPLNGSFSENGTDVSGGHVALIDSTNIELVGHTSESFDNTNYNAASFNRGFITVEFEA